MGCTTDKMSKSILLTNNSLNTINMPRHDRSTTICLHNKFVLDVRILASLSLTTWEIAAAFLFVLTSTKPSCLSTISLPLSKRAIVLTCSSVETSDVSSTWTHKATIIYFLHDFIINNRIETTD